MTNTKILKNTEIFIQRLKDDYDLMIRIVPDEGHYLIQEYENKLIGALNILNYLGIIDYSYVQTLYNKYRM